MDWVMDPCLLVVITQVTPVCHAVSELVIHAGGGLPSGPPHLPHHVQPSHSQAPCNDQNMIRMIVKENKIEGLKMMNVKGE